MGQVARGPVQRRGGARAVAALALVAMLAAACGDDPDSLAGGEDPTVETAAVDDEGLIPFCDSVPVPGPIAEGNLPGTANPDDVLMGVLQTYANDRPDTFGGLWIDRGAGSVVLAFTDDAAAHRAAIAELRPSPDDDAISEPPPEITSTTTVAESGTTVDVVQVAHSEAELRALAEGFSGRLSQGDFGLHGLSVATNLNQIQLYVTVADEATRAALADELPIDVACVEGPATMPEPIDPDAVDLLTVEDDPMVTCSASQRPFRLSALDAPLGFEQSDDPAAEALRESLPDLRIQMGDLVDDGWRRLGQTGPYLLLAAGDPPSAFVTLEQAGDRWHVNGSSGGDPCEPRRSVPEGVAEVRWGLDPAHPEPAPADTEIHTLVTSMECSGGEPTGDRVIGPQVEMTADEVVVAFAAIPLPPGGYTCPGSPPTPVVVTLDEPIGDRTIVDGLDLEPREPVAAVERW